MRRLLMTIALAVGLGAIGLSAHADEAGWTAWDTAAGGDRAASALSTVTCDAAAVTWEADTEASAAGSSIEHQDLGLDVDAGDTITVDYTMSAGADPAGGSARLFVYYTPDADTWSVAPDQQAVADTTEGTLSITSDGGTIGTIGVVYDTSGGSPGTVTYSNLTVAGEPVPFCTVEDEDPEVCEWDDELTANDEDCVKPDDEDQVDESDESKDESDVGGSDGTSNETSGSVVGSAATLPDTGASAALIGLAGLSLVGAGGAAIWADKHRRPAARYRA